MACSSTRPSSRSSGDIRRLLVGAIHGYRALARVTGFRRTCLYRVSCSRHVEATTRADGFAAGIRAMRHRFANCRPGYAFEFDGDAWSVTGVGGAVIPASEASDALHREMLTVRALAFGSG